MEALTKLAGPIRKNETYKPFLIPGRRQKNLYKRNKKNSSKNNENEGAFEKDSESSDGVEAIGPKGSRQYHHNRFSNA